MSLLNQCSTTQDSGTSKVAFTMGAALAFGLLAVFVSLASSGTVARGLMWAAAWSSIGWFLGFLFGIPRFLSTDTARRPGAAKAEATADKAAHAAMSAAGDGAGTATGGSLTVNTNLEQISDWLTKIIVGVSLVESQALLSKLDAAASFMARSMAPPDQLAAMAGMAVSARHAAAAASGAGAGPALAASAAELGAASARHLEVFGSTHSLAYAVILYFLSTGLLGSYLLTRLFLQPALNDAAGVVSGQAGG